MESAESAHDEHGGWLESADALKGQEDLYGFLYRRAACASEVARHPA